MLGNSPDEIAELSLPKGVILAHIDVVEIFSSVELAVAQHADPGLQWCFDFVDKGKVVPGRSPLREVFVHNKNRLMLCDNVLLRKQNKEGETPVLQKVVPADLRPRVLHYFHCPLTAGHLGADRMETTMLRSVW